MSRRAPFLALTTLVVTLAAATLPAAGAPIGPVRLVHAPWSSSVASTYLACAVLREELDQPCEAESVTAERMWELVADGQADAFLSAWLPDTHAHFMKRYGPRLDDLGPNLEGTRTGLVVPAVSVGRQTGAAGARPRPYVTVQSIPELKDHREQFKGRILGIDPEAGIMRATERALDVYGLDGYRLVSGSEAEMTAALADAIAHQQWIVVTGWTPHWMFGRWSLRFLDDPKHVYGAVGSIHTMARQGLAADRPDVYRFLDRFHWTPEAMNQLMVWIEQDEGRDPYAQAERWLRTHPQRVRTWLE
ncbi:MAG: glycine betaine ABC transporter substrate-binding protein [Chromatiaceae bacterium]